MTTVAHFSLAHFEHMVALGAFSGHFEKQVELLRGEIVAMNPIGPSHFNVVGLLTDWSYEVVPIADVFVGIQGPIRIPVSDSEPQPDVVWTVRRDFSKRLAEPSEVLLLIEVADSSLPVDRGEKLKVYAEARIADYWIVNLIDEQIEVHRNPVGNDYQDKVVYRGDTPLSPLSVPTAVIRPSRLFG